MIVRKYKYSVCEEVLNHHSRTLLSDNFNEVINPDFKKYFRVSSYKNVLDYDAVKYQISDIEQSQNIVVRRNAVVLVDVSLEAPNIIVEKTAGGKFFRAAFKYYAEFLQSKNTDLDRSGLTCFFHPDEDVPHVHFVFMPIFINPSGRRSFNAKQLVNRSFLIQQKTFLNDAISKDLGFDVGITNTNHEIQKSMEIFAKNHDKNLLKKHDDLIKKNEEILTKINESKKELKRLDKAIAEKRKELFKIKNEQSRIKKSMSNLISEIRKNFDKELMNYETKI